MELSKIITPDHALEIILISKSFLRINKQEKLVPYKVRIPNILSIIFIKISNSYKNVVILKCQGKVAFQVF